MNTACDFGGEKYGILMVIPMGFLPRHCKINQYVRSERFNPSLINETLSLVDIILF